MPEIFINESGFIGQLVIEFTQNISGAEAITFTMAILFLLLISLAFKIPLEISMLFSIPYVILLMSYSTSFLVIGGVYLMIITGYLIKVFFT